MALVTLTCPHCGYSKELDEMLLPPAGTKVTCPKCRGHFPLEICDPPKVAEPPSPSAPAFSASAAEPPAAPQLAQWFDPHVPPPSPPPPFSPPSPRTAAAPERRRTLTFAFTGTAREYFGIWIVNTLLRIVTLGIYSPWAKVRKRRYFYGNTLLDDAPFDYLADPLAILKGWFIAGLFFGLYALASRTSPVASFVLMLVFAGVFPWVVVRSRIFNLRNSSHRNIRFTFRPNYGEAYKVFLWWPLLVPFTLGILAPYVVYRQKRFLVENSAYGTTLFSFDAAPKQYFRVFLPLLLLVPLALAAMAGTAFLLPKGGGSPVQAVLLPVVFMIIYMAAALYLPTALTNVSWSATSIGGHRFRCTLRVRDMAWIYISSALAILCTFGLLAPWAAVRLARYRLGKLTLSGVGRLDSVVAAGDEAMGATGEELVDMLGFDLGL